MAVVRGIGRALWYIVLFLLLTVVFTYNGLLIAFIVGAINSGWFFWGFALEAALVGLGLSPPGQAAVAWITGFRPPTPSQLRYLTAVLSSVRSRTGYRGRVVLHVIPGRGVNAFALGTRHIGVTPEWFQLPRPEQEAVLAHEVGHLAGRHSVMSGSLSIMSTAGNWLGWLALWVALGLLAGAVLSSLRRRKRADGMGLAMYPLAFALFNVLMSLLIWAMWAVYSRQSEYEADAFASRHGYRFELASALRHLAPPRFTGRSLTNTVWSSHPATWRRLRRLERPLPSPVRRPPAPADGPHHVRLF